VAPAYVGWPSRAPDAGRFARQPFDASTHVLREVASDPRAVHDAYAGRLTPEVLTDVLDLVPDAWLEATPWLDGPEAVRAAYLELLTARLAEPDAWLPGPTP
jgi:hypothetical protein